MKRVVTLAAALLLTVLCFSKIRPEKIQYGPWIQNVTETGFTVIFKTAEPALTSVILAPEDGTAWYNADRLHFHESISGRRVTGTMHRIKVTGLQPGTAYRYRIIGKDVVDDEYAYGTFWGPEFEYTPEIHGIKTLDSKAETCRFSVVNDIHAHFDHYRDLTKSLKASDLDFFVMNGDMVSSVNSIDTMMKYTFGPAADLLSQVSSIYVRGNHESRGREFHLVPSIFDSPTGEFYFCFRQGPCAFLILDGGEDKPDSHGEYSGTADFDAYRLAQLEWMKEAVKDPRFQSAPWRIVLIHIPTISHMKPWYTQQWLCDNFVPVLNEAGVDLMISGHHHQYIYVEPEQDGNTNRFPIVANSNTDRLDCTVDGKEIKISIVNSEGKVVHSHVYKK